MIRQLAILAVAGICLAASTNATETSGPEQQMQLRALIAYFYGDGTVAPEFYQDVNYCEAGTDFNRYEGEWPEVMRKFCERYRRSEMLPRGSIFSVYCPYQLQEAVLLFKALHFAPTWEDFRNFAVWSYKHVNEYQFHYSFHIAFIHRPGSEKFPLKKPYQQYPEWFFNTDAMKQIYDSKMSLAEMVHPTEEHPHNLTVVANYTNWYIANMHDHEYNLTYFMEDIDLNAWYFNLQMTFPFWMSSQEFPEIPLGRRGEIYYFTHKMLVNRYEMERSSHGLDKMELLDWEKPIMTGYSPYMMYPNGLHFPERPAGIMIPICLSKYVQEVQEFESRITEAIDSGLVLTEDDEVESIHTEDGFEGLCNIIQGNNDSINRDYYGSIDALARRALGFSREPFNYYQILPSALEHSSTSLRDPAFYRLYTKILDHFFKYKERLGPYTSQQLAFEGVAIESVDILGKLYTYFERRETLIDGTWPFGVTIVPRRYRIMASQYRLNHHPFAYNIIINSARDIKASVRIFLGPKYFGHGEKSSDHYQKFIELDYFVENLKKGTHSYLRNSSDSVWAAPRANPRSETFENVVKGEDRLTWFRRRNGFPSNLLLPMGTPAGMPFEFFFYVSEFGSDTNELYLEPYIGVHDNKPLGFPLDRPIDEFHMPNMYSLVENIYHKDE